MVGRLEAQYMFEHFFYPYTMWEFSNNLIKNIVYGNNEQRKRAINKTKTVEIIKLKIKMKFFNELNNLIICTVLVLFIMRFLYSFPLRGRYRFSPFLGGCY